MRWKGFKVFVVAEVSQGHRFAPPLAPDSLNTLLIASRTTEKDALKADGTPSTSSKVLALNKSGHGLHVCDPLFQSYSTSSKIASLVRSLGWVDPRIPQSMYIFKQPRIGGEVTSHQDSTFLHTEEASSGEPAQSCLGLWLALHPATVENGCLWVRPGSHREPLRRRFVRNPKRFVEGDDKAPQMIFEDCPGGQASAAPWEGKVRGV